MAEEEDKFVLARMGGFLYDSKKEMIFSVRAKKCYNELEQNSND